MCRPYRPEDRGNIAIPRPNDLGYYVTALQALPCLAITLNVFTIFFQCRPINKNVSLIFFQCHAIILIVFTIFSIPRLRGLASPARAPHTSPGRQAWVRNGPLISGLKCRHNERRFIESRANIPHNVPTLQAGI